ncbi:hypothetical protein IJG14_01715 [bacterium]|nr:hypothetical protein [bacterium]
MKTYIDNSGGGGGSEILYGPSEPDDSVGENGQLYVVIPELAEDDYSTIRITYNFPNGWKRQKQSFYVDTSTGIFAAYLEAYNFAVNAVENYISITGNDVQYPARIYGPYTELYTYQDWDYGTSAIYTNLSSAVSALNSKASEYGGSVTLNGTTLTYTYNGQSTTYTNFNSCVSAVSSDYEAAMGWTSWQFTAYTNGTYYYYSGDSWEGVTVFPESSFGSYIYSSMQNCVDYSGGYVPVVEAYYYSGDNKIEIHYAEYDESLITPITETYTDVQQAADKFNEIIFSGSLSLTAPNIKAERL